jgi:Domain of unknown function (DUF397)
MIDPRPHRPYVKSSRSGGSGGNCVEWAHTSAGVYIRDSKNPDGPEILATLDEWAAVVDAVILGEPHPWIAKTSTGVTLDRNGCRLNFTPGEWTAFTEGALLGECVLSGG